MMSFITDRRLIDKKIFLIGFMLAAVFSQDLNKDSLNHQLVELSDLDIDLYLYDSYLEEAKMFFSEFVIADMTSDTSNALYGLKQLYETLSIINSLEGKDEIQQLEFNKILVKIHHLATRPRHTDVRSPPSPSTVLFLLDVTGISRCSRRQTT